MSKTKVLFSNHGTKTLLFSKFVPGLSTLAPPLAGIAQVPFPRFVFYDGLGSLIWALAPLIVGAYLQKSFVALQTQVYSLVPYLPWICGFLILAVLAWRYVNRTRYMKELRESLRGAVDPEELKRRLDRGEDVFVLDVRDPLDARSKPVTLPKTRWIPYTALTERFAELPLDKPIIVYCDCPEDQGSVAVSDDLRERGLKLTRPLRGGLSAWMRKGFETVELAPAAG